MMTPLYKFYLKVRVNTESGCWLWTGTGTGRFGYGGVYFNGRTEPTHRVSWVLHRGEIPSGLSVLHKCDVPRCVNPDHLFLGTRAENNHDRDSKGRQVSMKGENNGNSALTESDVIAIRGSHQQQRSLAKQYGVSQSTIGQIKRGLTWSHV